MILHFKNEQKITPDENTFGQPIIRLDQEQEIRSQQLFVLHLMVSEFYSIATQLQLVLGEEGASGV